MEIPVKCEALRLERERRGWSRLDVTLQAWDVTRKKVSPETIARIETGQIPAYAPTREALCQTFEMEEIQLFPERFVPCRASGDRPEDEQAAANAGIPFVSVKEAGN